jgi:O-methyltransferase
VECGVFQAANVHIMIRMLQRLGVDDRDVYLYDTFAGMPKPSEVDDEGLNNALKVTYETFRTEEGSDWMCAGLDQVRARIDALGYPSEHIHFVKGLVEDTVPAQAPEQIALLRLDTDFYSSTKHELLHLYPRVAAAGGVLIIDDYGGMPGCRTAVEEYASEHRPGWLLNRIDAHVRQVVKPK